MIGQRIRQRREFLHLTGAELARRASMSRSFLYEIEVHERSPSADLLQRLASALDTTADDLLGSKGSEALLHQRAVVDVLAEQKRQDEVWGRNTETRWHWITRLSAALGEAGRAVLAGDAISYRAELVKLAAIVLGAINALDKGSRKECE